MEKFCSIIAAFQCHQIKGKAYTAIVKDSWVQRKLTGKANGYLKMFKAQVSSRSTHMFSAYALHNSSEPNLVA